MARGELAHKEPPPPLPWLAAEVRRLRRQVRELGARLAEAERHGQRAAVPGAPVWSDFVGVWEPLPDALTEVSPVVGGGEGLRGGLVAHTPPPPPPSAAPPERRPTRAGLEQQLRYLLDALPLPNEHLQVRASARALASEDGPPVTCPHPPSPTPRRSSESAMDCEEEGAAGAEAYPAAAVLEPWRTVARRGSRGKGAEAPPVKPGSG